MGISFFTTAALLLCTAFGLNAAAIGEGRPVDWIKPYKSAPLQDIVTWDEHSIFVHGTRVMFFSGEFHPFRLPVPSLWLDVFQKIKAMGFNGVSFYVDWGLVEGEEGVFRAEGVFAWEPFFAAAKEAGIYLLARPGPYINAETSGGGLPGWLQRNPGRIRTPDSAYLNATELYAASIGKLIADAQITNGGPVILFQPENEYAGVTVPFPDYGYWEYVEEQFRKAGVVVPFVNNESWVAGLITTTTPGAVDIYGHDNYPIGFDCPNPHIWPDNYFPTTYLADHVRVSPKTPYAIIEFQGGSFDNWGGSGFEQCIGLVNHEYERVFYKNAYAAGITIFNIYMTFGGTNWGNLGHAEGYTSYDYAAAISEERLVTREKYSELKLEANFLQVSPAYLVADRRNATTSFTDNPRITVTTAVTHSTKFYFIRQTAYNSLASEPYRLSISTTSHGTIAVPQTEGVLTLNGRDSKVYVSDYKAGDANIVYSTAEIFTWRKYSDKTVIVVYGGVDEQHELAIEQTSNDGTVLEGSGVSFVQNEGYTVLNWVSSTSRAVVKIHKNVYIYMLDRNAAYNYWVAPTTSSYELGSVILKAGYLIRSAEISGNTLSLVGDVNATTPLEIIGGAPSQISSLLFNGKDLSFKRNNSTYAIVASVPYQAPEINLPQLSTLEWKYMDSLPEIQPSYSDSAWTAASLRGTYNTLRNITTPTSLYSGDYGYNAGSLIFRGHFSANGNESTLDLWTQGGSSFGMSAWINSQFIGSHVGIPGLTNANTTFTLPELTAGREYVFTIVIDHMGLDGNWMVGLEKLKNQRGILDYVLAGHPQEDVEWKITGNLGGETYLDKTRGPLNEGGMFAERHGYHLPNAPTTSWESVPGGPMAGITSAGIAYYTTSFTLDIPAEYDVPLSFVFANSTTLTSAYRVQLYVNGYQFGKYVHNLGPQDKYPVPQGILNYRGKNWVGLTLWALEADGASVEKLDLVSGVPVQWSYDSKMSEMTDWSEREGAY